MKKDTPQHVQKAVHRVADWMLNTFPATPVQANTDSSTNNVYILINFKDFNTFQCLDLDQMELTNSRNNPGNAGTFQICSDQKSFYMSNWNGEISNYALKPQNKFGYLQEEVRTFFIPGSNPGFFQLSANDDFFIFRFQNHLYKYDIATDSIAKRSDTNCTTDNISMDKNGQKIFYDDGHNKNLHQMLTNSMRETKHFDLTSVISTVIECSCFSKKKQYFYGTAGSSIFAINTSSFTLGNVNQEALPNDSVVKSMSITSAEDYFFTVDNKGVLNVFRAMTCQNVLTHEKD